MLGISHCVAVLGYNGKFSIYFIHSGQRGFNLYGSYCHKEIINISFIQIVHIHCHLLPDPQSSICPPPHPTHVSLAGCLSVSASFPSLSVSSSELCTYVATSLVSWACCAMLILSEELPSCHAMPCHDGARNQCTVTVSTLCFIKLGAPVFPEQTWRTTTIWLYFK